MKKISSLFIFLLLLSCFLFFSADKAEAALTEVTVYYLITNDTTPIIRGTVDDPLATVEVTVEGQAPHAATVEGDGNWSLQMGVLAEGEYDVEAEATLGLDTVTDTIVDGLYIQEDFPLELYAEDMGGDWEVTMITFLTEYTYTSAEDHFSLLFPEGVEITRTGGGNMNVGEWYAEGVDPNNERIIIKLRFGIPNIDLTFSEDITITFDVGDDYNGQTLYVFSRSDGGDDGWEQLTTCVVAGGNCAFQVSHASYFAVSEHNSIAEGEDDDDDEDEKASISSWKAYKYEDQDSKLCKDKLRLEIKGKHFDGDAEVKIGNHKAFSVDKKSSKKIVAKFCMDKLLNSQTSRRKTIRVTNPNTEDEEADKKINLKNVNWEIDFDDFSPETFSGTINIQKALISLGFLDEQYVTGFYGPLTTSAVIEFQKQNNIPQTGYAGPLTKAQLEEELD